MNKRSTAVAVSMLFLAVSSGLVGLFVTGYDGEEGRRVLMARGMLEEGHWVIPHLAGEPYLTKPPLAIADAEELAESPRVPRERREKAIAAIDEMYATAPRFGRFAEAEAALATGRARPTVPGCARHSSAEQAVNWPSVEP